MERPRCGEGRISSGWEKSWLVEAGRCMGGDGLYGLSVPFTTGNKLRADECAW